MLIVAEVLLVEVVVALEVATADGDALDEVLVRDMRNHAMPTKSTATTIIPQVLFCDNFSITTEYTAHDIDANKSKKPLQKEGLLLFALSPRTEKADYCVRFWLRPVPE